MHKKGPVEKIWNKVHFWVDSTTRKDTIMAPRIRLSSTLLTVGKLEGYYNGPKNKIKLDTLNGRKTWPSHTKKKKKKTHATQRSVEF